MGKLSVSGMAAVETERVIRRESLKALTSVPFDVNNKEHLTALTKYNDHFEKSINLKYLYEALGEGWKIGVGGWILGLVLPIPDFTKYFIALAGAGYVLDRMSKTDFHEDLSEMKYLYNWCFKGGEENYSSQIDNTEKLGNPVLQRLIKLIAPLCSDEFLLVWPKLTEKPLEVQSGWSNVMSLGYAAASSTFSIFASAKPGVDLNRIRELKTSVETREFDVGLFIGCERAIKYFATNSGLMLMSKVETAKNMLSTALSEASPTPGLSIRKMN